MVLNSYLTDLLSKLRTRGLLPQHIQKAEFNGLFMFNCFNSIQSEIVTNGVSTGISMDEELALFKSLVEWIERNAFVNHSEAIHSDGFAGFPIDFQFDSTLAIEKSREIALNEAIERYVWSYWWDMGTEVTVKNNFYPMSYECINLVNVINKFTPLESLTYLIPTSTNYLDRRTHILYGKLKSGGYISGGSTEKTNLDDLGLFRALSEMMRHSIGYSRYKEKKLLPKSFYEERLIYFGDGLGNSVVVERLSVQSPRKSITLPFLEKDQLLQHDFSDEVAVYWCKFSDQPEFVGGDLDRLCL